jgi:hypothetical protein
MLTVWLIFGRSVLLPDSPPAFLQRLYDLSDLLGAGATTAALSFLAYLIGSLLSSRSIGPAEREDDPVMGSALSRIPWQLATAPITIARALQRRRGDRSELLAAWVEGEVESVQRTGTPIRSFLTDRQLPYRFVDALTSELDAIERHPDFAALSPVEQERRRADALTVLLTDWLRGSSEFATLKIRVQIEREGLFDEYSRLVSEGELRTSIYFPIGLIILAASLSQDPWYYGLACLPLLALPAVILRDGCRILDQSREIVFQALTTGVIESPLMSRLQELSELEGTGRPAEV